MKKLLIILPFIAQAALAQVDSLKHATDSIKNSVESKIASPITSVDHQLDSIQDSFTSQVDSLKGSYAKARGKIESAKNKYQNKIDSLNNIKLTTEKYTGKVDSLNTELAQVQQKVTVRIDSLKRKVTSKIKSLNLPPQASDKVAALTSSLDKINLPSIDADISSKLGLGNINGALPDLPTGGINTSMPSANLPAGQAGLPTTNLPGASLPSVNTPDLGVQENLGKVNDITGKAGDIQKQVKEVASVEGAGKAIENKVSELDQVKGIQEQTGLPFQAPATGEDAKKQLKDLAKKEAVNHFAGKEAVLQQAMEQMSKYKEKYNSVSSIVDLPEKRPNPLKEKPFIERVVPGITLQFQSYQYFMLDVNASAGYRFTEHITAGIGWNQRWAYSIDDSEFSSSARIYGPRSYGEYKFKKGFGVRADIEYVNTEVSAGLPPNEISHREWVWSAFSGIKQEYRISGRVKGNAQVMYNLFDPHHKSPYVDRLNVRMGFEFVIKKKKNRQ